MLRKINLSSSAEWRRKHQPVKAVSNYGQWVKCGGWRTSLGLY